MNASIKEILNSDDPYYEIEFYYGRDGVPIDDEKLCKEIAHKIESNSLDNKIEKDNCYAELASYFEIFKTEYKKSLYEIVNNFSELKEPLSLGDRIERFVWLNQLIQRIYELENKTPNESINKKIEELEKARDFIEYQLGISSKNNEIEINQNKEMDGFKSIWEIADPRDPPAEQPWYTSARYFARQLVKEDSTLLIKRKLLAGKIAKSLENVGIKKRGGKLPLSDSTILKALSNVEFN